MTRDKFNRSSLKNATVVYFVAIKIFYTKVSKFNLAPLVGGQWVNAVSTLQVCEAQLRLSVKQSIPSFNCYPCRSLVITVSLPIRSQLTPVTKVDRNFESRLRSNLDRWRRSRMLYLIVPLSLQNQCFYPKNESNEIFSVCWLYINFCI